MSRKIFNKNFKFFLLISSLSFNLFFPDFIFNSQGQVISNVIAPSPNAALLGKYGDMPVNLYSGQEQIAIPLYSVTDNSISLPIYLSYHGGGIKVEEVASWVGLGWSLNAGGVITRTVRGLPDAVTGFYDQNIDNENVSADSLLKYASNIKDSKPDLFSFNFNGRAGQFVYHQTKGIIPIPYQKIKIESFMSADSFTITTEDGTIYVFSAPDSTSSQTESKIKVNGIMYNNGTINSYFKSSWYLTKIRSTNGNLITLEYTPETVNFIVKGSEAYYECQGDCDSNVIGGVQTRVNNTITCQRLLRINFKSGKVEFTPSTTYWNYVGNKALQDIKIYNYNNELLKTINFYYSKIDDRLYLTSFKESNQGIETNPYLFTYYSNYTLPSRDSYSQDWAGCFNGKNSVNFFCFGIKIINIKNLDRTPDLNHAKTGSLSKITYPTGGYSEFDYTINTTSHPDYPQLGGLRIYKITDFDPVNSTYQLREFSYNTGTMTGPTNKYTEYLQMPEYNSYDIYTSYSSNPLTYSSGNPVVYTQATILHKYGSAENGKCEFTFYFKNNYAPDSMNAYDSEGKEWMRGLLLKQVDFKKDASGYDTVRKVVNTYYHYHWAISSSDPYIQNRCSNMANKYANGLAVYNCADGPYDAFYFKTSSGYFELVKSKEYTYNDDGQTYIKTESNMTYNENDLNLKQIVTTGSDGRNTIVRYKYPLEYTSSDTISYNGLNVSEAIGISKLVGKNIINIPIEILKKVDTKFTEATIQTFRYEEGKIFPYNVYTLKASNPLTSFTESYLWYNGGYLRWEFEKDDNYQTYPEITYDEFDNDGNLLQVHNLNGNNILYSYGYNNSIPIAQIENASLDDIYNSSFEENIGSNHEYGNSKTGNYSYKVLSGDSYSPGFVNEEWTRDKSGKYKASVWIKTESGFNGNAFLIIEVRNTTSGPIIYYCHTEIISTNQQWQYFEKIFDFDDVKNNNPTVTGFTVKAFIRNLNSSYFLLCDELRFHPLDASMTTYTYLPLLGVTSVTDPNNLTIQYEYDELGRLKKVMNQDRYILKQMNYHYKQ